MIPGFTSTGSKRPAALFGHLAPPSVRMTRAQGARLWDDEGREYLDGIMALGAVALGYAHPAVTDAVVQAVRNGAIGSLAPRLEQEVAARLAEVLPGVEAVRFLKTGAEAVAAAVRLARVVTGRDLVFTCGYHGWLDWCQYEPGVPQAIRDLRRTLRFNDRAELAAAVAAFGPPAAIVVEPVVDEAPEAAWLLDLRTTAARVGAVLIFDEIKTAFRLATGGAARRYGVTPDLMVVGKALGNGFPIAAVGGSADIMQAATRTWISSTHATEFASLAAANTVINLFETEGVAARLEELGERFMTGLRALAARYSNVVTSVRGLPQMCYLETGDEHAASAVALGCYQRGLLFKRSAYNFVSAAHTNEDIDLMLGVLDETLAHVERSC